jgi:uncharacterized protein YbjT (DUF2867 family)
MIKKLVVFGATGQTGMSSVEAALKHGKIIVISLICIIK